MKKTLILAFICLMTFVVRAQMLDIDYGVGGVYSHPTLTGIGFNLESALLEDGSMILVGTPNPSFMNNELFVTKVDPNGELDISYGDGGTVIYTLTEGFSFISDIALTDQDEVIVAGASFQTGWMYMLDSSGNPKSDFGDNGYLQTTLSGDVNSLHIEVKGNQIYVLHKANTNFLAHTRFDMQGNRITTFGNNGTKVYTDFGAVLNITDYVSSDEPFAQELNREYFAVYSQVTDQRLIGSIDLDGNIDMQFGVDSKYVMPDDVFVSSLAVDRNKDLLINGYQQSEYMIYKINFAGELQTDFAESGVAMGNYTRELNRTDDVLPLSDGRFLLLSSIGSPVALASVVTRHNINGFVDSNFGEDGELILDNEIGLKPTQIHKANNGDVYIAGHENNDDGSANIPFAAKYLTDFVGLDDSFIKSNVSIFPNPTTSATWYIEADIQVKVATLYDYSGNLISQLEISDDKLSCNQSLVNGNYLIVINNDQATIPVSISQ